MGISAISRAFEVVVDSGSCRSNLSQVSREPGGLLWYVSGLRGKFCRHPFLCYYRNVQRSVYMRGDIEINPAI